MREAVFVRVANLEDVVEGDTPLVSEAVPVAVLELLPLPVALDVAAGEPPAAACAGGVHEALAVTLPLDDGAPKVGETVVLTVTEGVKDVETVLDGVLGFEGAIDGAASTATLTAPKLLASYDAAALATATAYGMLIVLLVMHMGALGGIALVKTLYATTQPGGPPGAAGIACSRRMPGRAPPTQNVEGAQP